MRLALFTSVVLVALAAAASGAAGPPNAADLEAELVCPVCETTLDQSDAPVAQRMKTFIRERIAAGDTEDEIKDALVAVGAGAVVVALLVREWSRRRAPPAAETPLSPDLEQRVDEELARFES